jgi:pre-mRNA-splicing factor 38B
MKLFTMRLTAKQMDELINDTDSPLIRCLGFLYLRYTCPPKDLWMWFEPYLEDDEKVHPCSDPDVSTTIGEYCTSLLTELKYYNTPLPRIPVLIERKIKVMLLLLEQKQQRRKDNSRVLDRFQVRSYFFSWLV